LILGLLWRNFGTSGVITPFMKLSHILLILVASSTVVFARVVFFYDNTKPPSMPLPAGYERAVKALGSYTNQFYCIRASTVGAGFSTAIDGPTWFFTFCSTNTPPKYKWVTVGFNGKTDVDDQGFPKDPE
jgi:hypothetical protein